MFIVCDESKQGKANVIGGVSIKYEEAIEFEKICFIKRYENMVFGEIAWKNITSKGKYTDFYLELIRLFFSFPSARFHSNSFKINQYKAGYSLIRSISWKLHGINSHPKLSILFDGMGETGKREIQKTREALQQAYASRKSTLPIYHQIRMCNQTDSNVINLCQIADLLVGAVTYKLGINNSALKENPVSKYFVSQIEELDGNLDMAFSIPHKLWKYDEKKIQHYNLT